MTEESNKIPLPGAMDPQPRKPDFLQGDEWFETQVDDDFLDFDEPYRPPRYTMERDGVPFADVGELHIISGKPGNGKTGLMSQLEAATLGRKFGNTLARDVGHIVRDEYSCLENPMDGGAWWAAVHGVAKSWTRLSNFPFTFHFHALEKEMAIHCSVLAWRIPGTGEPGGLPSMGSHRVGHD